MTDTTSRTYYRVTDARTLAQRWVAGLTPSMAAITHENQQRNLDGRRRLEPGARTSNYSQGDMIDVSIGHSVVRGLKMHVEWKEGV
jgi:hypothetical protein